ncbi:MAG: tRNA pseudouridine(38-40) synthase TruA [Cyclobacteriaceae bacterium]
MRYFMDLSYKGTAYHGWQIQPNAPTVQEEINKALSLVLQQKIECVGSGRTDTGVHAKQQVAHLDLEEVKLTLDQLTYRLNGILPADISIKQIRQVKPDAHARFDATRRTYHYHLHKIKDPFITGQSYYFTKELDVSAIAKSIEIIRDWKIFQAFSKVHTEVNNFNCEIFEISWEETNVGYTFCVSANRFLRGMVRAMVGTLLDVGSGKIDTKVLTEILDSGDRSRAGRSVPAEGLFLSEVLYPESVYLEE